MKKKSFKIYVNDYIISEENILSERDVWGGGECSVERVRERENKEERGDPENISIKQQQQNTG